MASKPIWKKLEKDKNQKSNSKTIKNEFLDEIALRDEIFDLKRQILILKKSNERNLIKLRKYEDETKKKDRQIEQLMDPVKNGDIRKLLSTKGAALLLNLKEQNNTLIQMVLAKDVQIRKLLSEIKTSKLYTASKRTESYRGEIDRLRNLLVKSQNTLKETQDIQQKRSICVGGTPDKEMAFSSEQSSPRDLEELHFTIQTLEVHMKYSNELIAKKNEQILQLTDQLNSLQSCNCRKNARTKYFLDKYTKPTGENFWKASREEHGDRSYETESSSTKFLLAASPGAHRDWRRLPSSAPPCPVRNPRDDSQSPDPGSDPRRSPGNAPGKKPESIANGTWLDETRQFPKSEFDNAKEYENSFVPSDISNEKTKNSAAEEESDVDTEEFEMMEKKIENDQIEIESPVKLAPDPSPSGNSGLDESPEEEEEEILVFLETEDKAEDMILEKEEQVHRFGKTPSRDECDSNVSDEEDKDNSESAMELYRYSLDSSSDSDISPWNAVQVEAEINRDCEIEKCVKSDESGDGNKNANENNNNNDNNNDDDDGGGGGGDDNDDDDVIIG